eukprot:Blabericola_migrator_1__5152@NODE_265_length_10621_cov_160_318363_g221_i0_p5_GENE_NODE_265_length_10621_cov_160_318363_g221_i0NODE_265_length_10621_cov_160_318363_g221_i0_p5_ORF_typecomplete_len344_score29_73CYSTM/PF12734_7/3_2e03CYSTM/PF12734_7/2_7e03CYSTM/PF12734_7/1_8e04CYSTM/PF12734_7/0_041CYSTM/PF12734_7/5e03CYSTM/PF12734_7/6_1e02_NODE_265_length_10621_cov_160_318363_g221_i046815712
MAKHRHHHHHSKSPSRRPPSPENSRPLFQGDPAAERTGVVVSTNRKSENARHRHRSTPPRAEISRRRSVEDDAENNVINVSHPGATDFHQYAALAAESLNSNHHAREFNTGTKEGSHKGRGIAKESQKSRQKKTMGKQQHTYPSHTHSRNPPDSHTQPQVGYSQSPLVEDTNQPNHPQDPQREQHVQQQQQTQQQRTQQQRSSSSHQHVHYQRSNAGYPLESGLSPMEYERMVGASYAAPPYTTVRNRQASIHYEGPDPRAHVLMRPHRKYYISKREKGCLGPCNAACCCGVFDREGLCGYMNCYGCCDRESKLLRRIGSFNDNDGVRTKRQQPNWCTGCCCC